jgi:hypothetical protein
MQCKQLASLLDAPDQINQVTDLLGTQSTYMQLILKSKQRHSNQEKAGQLDEPDLDVQRPDDLTGDAPWPAADGGGSSSLQPDRPPGVR